LLRHGVFLATRAWIRQVEARSLGWRIFLF